MRSAGPSRGRSGLIDQMPPQFSALKVEGRRAYDLAQGGPGGRAGSSRPVRVDRIELISYEWPRLEFTVDCGSGTYIRSIARDVGEALGCGGLIEVLVRTRIGPFLQADADRPDRAADRARSSPGSARRSMPWATCPGWC